MVGVCGKVDLGVSLYVGQCVLKGLLWDEVVHMGTSGNRDCQWASRSVLKDFTEDAMIISASSLFRRWTAGLLKAYW